MRTVLRCLALCLSITLPAYGASATTPEDEPPSAATTAVPEPQTVLNSIDARIAALEASEPLAARKQWLQEIRSYYAQASDTLWVSETGFRPAARAVMDEIRKADDWGLDAKAFKLPADANPTAGMDALADAEIALTLAAVEYASQARGGRINPQELSLWLDQQPRALDVGEFLRAMASGNDRAAVLRQQHPQNPQFEALRQAFLALREKVENPEKPDPKLILQPGPKIKPGEWHPDVMIVRKRLNVPVEGDYQSLFDDKLASAVTKYLRNEGVKLKKKQVAAIDDKLRALLNRPPPAPSRADLDRIVANMERWRWMPASLGSEYVWNNLPEYTTRLIRNGKVVHEERIIIGQPDSQTPVFSETMKFIVFHPTWGVPASIKVRDLLPKILAGDYDVLRRRGMYVEGNSGEPVDPDRINWRKRDIRTVGIVQYPGRSNPLGQLKLMFPNGHDVYMHDTPQRHLFKSAARAFSHGCIRVRNPKRLVELILAGDKGWSAEDVAQRLEDDTPNDRVDLDRPIPVHNVYFTEVVDKRGQLHTFKDVYGHDRRVTDALKGKSIAAITARDPARKQKREVAEMSSQARARAVRVANDERYRDDYYDDDEDEDRGYRSSYTYREWRQPRSNFWEDDAPRYRRGNRRSWRY
jgi:murein L,D-transpeptidase YcbB/YkuD